MMNPPTAVISLLLAVSTWAHAAPTNLAPTTPTALHTAIEHIAGHYSGGDKVLRLAPMPCDAGDNCLYVELVQRGQERIPIRQEVWGFQPDSHGDLSLTLYAFPPRLLERFMPSLADVAVGLWAAPDRFPRINLDDLVPLGLARATFSTDNELTITTPSPLLFHRDRARSISLTVKTGATLQWSQNTYDAQGQSIDSLNLTLSRTRETTPVRITPEGMVVIDLRIGTGVELAPGDAAVVEFTIIRVNGQLVDSTRMAGRSVALLRPAPGDYFQGFKQGVLGMKASEKEAAPGHTHLRKLVVPAVLAFGAKGRNPIIGPDEPLIVDLELLTLRDNTKD